MAYTPYLGPSQLDWSAIILADAISYEIQVNKYFLSDEDALGSAQDIKNLIMFRFYRIYKSVKTADLVLPIKSLKVKSIDCLPVIFENMHIAIL